MLKWRRYFFYLSLLILITISMVASPVTIWSPQSVEWNRIIQDLSDTLFTPKTLVPVQVQTIPWSGFEQKYLLAAANEAVPEIGITGSFGPADLGVRGTAVNLSEYGTDYQDLKDQMYPGLMQPLEYNNASFGLPMHTVLYTMIYRSDILQDLGVEVPKTWDELYMLLPKLQANDKNFYTGSAFKENQADVYADVSMFIWQNGGDWYNSEGTGSGLGSANSVNGFREFVELFTKRGLPKAAESFIGFKGGDLPLVLTSMWQYANIDTSAPELKGKWSLALVPGTKQVDGSINHAAYSGGMTFALFKDAKRVDDGFLWLKWFLSSEVQAMMAERVAKEVPGSIFIPANKNAVDLLSIPKEHAQVVMKQAEASLAPRYALASLSTTQRFINFAAYEAVVEGKNPEEAIKKAARDMTVELERKMQEYARFIEKL